MWLAVVFFGWIVGAFATASAITILGSRKPTTIGDSFSGDDNLDFIAVACWPLFWPCYAAWHLVARAMSR